MDELEQRAREWMHARGDWTYKRVAAYARAERARVLNEAAELVAEKMTARDVRRMLRLKADEEERRGKE